MGFYNRRLLLLNEDEPSYPDASLPPGLIAIPSSSLLGRPLKLPAPSVLNLNVACIILILFAVLFSLGFITLCIRKFADDSPSAVSSRRRSASLAFAYDNSQASSCGGLDQTTVESLPVLAYHGEAKHQVDCAICLGEFKIGEAVKMIPNCKHVFHPECIDTWLFAHVTCPICRGTNFFTVERCAGLGKVEQSGDQDGSDHQERSTVENGEMWREVMGTSCQRRSSSCSNFRDTVVLPRTFSY